MLRPTSVRTLLIRDAQFGSARKWLSGVLMLAGLTACSTSTVIPNLPRDVADAWDTSEVQNGALPRPDLTDWWKAFGDSTLDRLVDTALAGDLTVKIAGERLNAARRLHYRSRSDFWPNLNFRVYEETAPGGETGFLEMGFDTTWELGLFGRSEGHKRVNAADFGSALIDEAAARITVTAEVARTYVDLCAAQQRAAIVRDSVAIRQRQVDVMQARLATHLGSRLDVERARSELENALAEEADSKVPIAEAQAGLAVLLGQGKLDPAIQPATAPPALPALDVAQPPADLVRTRPEIRHAELNVLHAAGELGIARADLYPQLSIVGTLISSTALTGDLDSPNKAVPLLGPTITLPLVDWNARRALVDARESAVNAAVLSYREAVLEGIAEVQTALARYQAKTASVANAESSFDLARRSLDTSRNTRRIGLIDDSDVSSAELVLEQAELTYSAALRDRAVSYIALYKAFGGNLPARVKVP